MLTKGTGEVNVNHIEPFKGNLLCEEANGHHAGKGDDLVILHNHPRNKPFSKMDLSVFISEEQIKTLTVVKNNGSVEILTKSVNYTMQKALIFLKRSIKKHDKNIDKAVNHFLLNTGGIIIWKKSDTRWS